MLDAYFEQVDRETDRLFLQEKYSDALALLDAAGERFPEHALDILVYQAFIYAFTGDTSGCYNTVLSAMQRGLSFPLGWRSFALLKDHPGYAELVEENERLLARDRQGNAMQFVLRFPAGHDPERPYPLALVLHGDGVDGCLSWLEWQWKAEAMLARGYVVGYVQSSQALMTGRFGWLPDPKRARLDVAECYRQVNAQVKVDPDRVIIGGFSGGAIAALDIAFAQVIPAMGFIGLCPEIKPSGLTAKSATLAAQRGMRGVILEGEQTYPTPDQREMLPMLDRAGFAYRLVINAGISHAVPDDFQQKLAEGLDFLVSPK